MSYLRWTLPAATLALSLLVSSPALAFELFQSHDADVERGNQRMQEQDYAAAREAYEAAVRRLPSEGAVHLDRGLALMAGGDLDQARSSFLAATAPPASREIRAAAYYDMGLAFYRQGEAAAQGAQATPPAAGAQPNPGAGGVGPSAGALPSPGVGAPGAAAQPDHREAQRAFREAADGFRRSLRLKPGNRDAAWNLELALRRIQEEQEAQQQQDQQNQDQQNQDQQNQDQQSQDQQSQDQQSQDQQSQDQQSQDQQSQDQQSQDQQSQDQQSQDQQSQDQQSQDQQSQDQQSQDQQSQDQQSQDQDQQESPGQALPERSRRLLDALQDGEESLQQLRARQRGGERHAPAQDW